MYWKLLSSCGEQRVRTNVTNDEFYQYFENISNPCDEFYSVDPDIKESLNNIIHSDLQEIFEELNVPIDRNEVYIAVKELKTGKSGGDDLPINELFVHGKDILVPYLTNLFNYSFESGVFPSAWTEGLLVPLHKKGNHNNAENFRGITLLSVSGKLYTRVLNNGLDKWAESYRIYIEAQFGFRKGRSTVDCVFILQSIIQKFLRSGKKLYAFLLTILKRSITL